LGFELIALTKLKVQPSQALGRYSDLYLNTMRQSISDLQVVDTTSVLYATADGSSEGRRLQWTAPSLKQEGLTQMGIDVNNQYVYSFVAAQFVGEHYLPKILDLAATSFFPLGASPNSAYAFFGTAYTDFGFKFRYPSDAEPTLSSFSRGLDELAKANDGHLILAHPSVPELHTDFSWTLSEGSVSAKTLQNIMLANLGDVDDPVRIVGQGELYLHRTTSPGRYFETEMPSGQGMIGAWQCPDGRVYIFRVKNDFEANGLEILYLFQRFLIGFACD